MYEQAEKTIHTPTGGIGKLPYRVMVERYRAKLNREKDPAKREEYEVIIAIMLSCLETQEKMDEIIAHLAKLEK